MDILVVSRQAQKQQVELLLFLEFHSAFEVSIEVVQFLVALFFKILNNKILWGLPHHRTHTHTSEINLNYSL